MMEKCFDEGVIQAFFDGELEHNMLENVARHVSDCDGCAVLMSDIEAESAMLTAAFEIDNFELVPTERLRTKIFAEIAELKNGRASWFTRATQALGFSNGFKLTSPQVAAFASLVLVAGVVGYVITARPDSVSPTGPAMAKNSPKQITNSQPSQVTPPIDNTQQSGPDKDVRPGTFAAPQGYRVTNASYEEPRVRPVRTVMQPLADERNYLKTINTLEKSVDDRKDDMLKPSNVVAYERDMAVVDDAIKKMQKIVRKNPKDDASKQLLMASYQNKIDLLSAASEKTELMASMR